MKKLFLHCGFPKTGTTSLQSWLTNNPNTLAQSNAAYPSEMKDDEGLGHHQLIHYALRGPEELARALAEGHEYSQTSIIFSAEGMANILGSESVNGYIFFARLVELLQHSYSEVNLLFTLRPVRTYMRSILVQNIIYDRVPATASESASGIVDTLCRCYMHLNRLIPSGAVRIFLYSDSVNHDIITFISGKRIDDARYRNTVPALHKSGSDSILLLFMWMNKHSIKLSSDLHGYICFNEDAKIQLDKVFAMAEARSEGFINYITNWRMPVDLAGSNTRFHQELFSSIVNDNSCLSSHFNDMHSILKSHVLNDFACLVSDSIIKLDYIHSLISNHIVSEELESTLDSLRSNARICLGKEV